MDKQRGRRLTKAESDLVARQDLYDPYEFDEDLVKEISDYFTGPYEREITVVCESCGKIGTMVDKMPAGYTRIGVLHAVCSECLTKMMKRGAENN